MDSEHPTTVYHGTSRESAESIMREGFRLNGHQFGKVLWTSPDKSVAEAYAHGDNPSVVESVLSPTNPSKGDWYGDKPEADVIHISEGGMPVSLVRDSGIITPKRIL